MHRKNTHRWSKLFSAASILALLFGGLVSQSVRAVSANPAPVCVGATCTVTFDYTGDYYSWTPPSGAKNVSFDLMGGQGGRIGGLGGRVQGSFVSTPSTLLIYVAGAGAQGNFAAGGYNGGGNAGSGHTDEGSGGGATDIRTTAALADRQVVAGGGGGSGGFSGGTGGNAGGLTGVAGVTGQGQGGAGATQTGGGSGGYPNGGTWGANGTLGNGGGGGYSTVSGGGGGGGGFYGGGGGGADIDSCCTNGGGGGGGSSWANATLTSSVVHTAGYRSGNGLAILTYVMPPQVSSFAAAVSVTNVEPINYNLVFNQAVTGLSSSSFVTTDSTDSCSTITVTGSGTTYAVAVSGCTDGLLKLTLNPNSVLGVLPGPTVAVSAATVTVDRVGPTVVLTPAATVTNASMVKFNLVANEPVTDLTGADLAISGLGCAFDSVTGTATTYVVNVSGCVDGANASVTLSADAVKDAAGNTGPRTRLASAVSSVDRTPPVFSIANPASPTVALSMNYAFTANKVVTDLTVGDFTVTGNGCSVSSVSGAGADYSVTVSGCADSVSVWLTMKANSVQDAAGNWGPISATATSGAVLIGIRPVATPTPTPTPSATATATPTATPAPTTTLAPTPTGTISAPAPPVTPIATPATPISAPAPIPTAEPTASATPNPSATPNVSATPTPLPTPNTIGSSGSDSGSWFSALITGAAKRGGGSGPAGGLGAAANRIPVSEAELADSAQAQFETPTIVAEDSVTLKPGTFTMQSQLPAIISVSAAVLIALAAVLAIRVVRNRRANLGRARRLVPVS